MKTTLKAIITAAISLIILLIFFFLFLERPTSVEPIAEVISNGAYKVKEEAVSISVDAMDELSDKYTQPAESVNDENPDDNADENTDDSIDDNTDAFETEETNRDTS